MRQELDRTLAGMAIAVEVDTLTGALRHVLTHQAKLDTLARVVWERLLEGERWKASFESLEELRTQFGTGDELETLITRSVARERLLTRADTALRTYSKSSLSSVFPSDPEQNKFGYSKHFLENAVTFASITSKARGLEYLDHARQQRLQCRNSRNTDRFIPEDFRKAIKELRVSETTGSCTGEIEARAQPESTKFDARPASNSAVCPCPYDLVRELLPGMPKGDPEEKDRICGMLKQQGSRLCHRHLRLVMGQQLQMCTNMRNSVLLERMEKYLSARRSGKEADLRQKLPGWFRGSSRDNRQHAAMGMWKYRPQASDVVGSIGFDPRTIFRRQAPAGTYDRWLADGTVILEGIFDYLVSSPETFALIDREFDIYKYHTREEMHGKKRNGWIRTMFYSVIQQVVRQDLVCYALNVAARLDMNFRLISYPYYTKDTNPGENTGFKHLDLNVPRLLSESRGINIVQCSVSIDN